MTRSNASNSHAAQSINDWRSGCRAFCSETDSVQRALMRASISASTGYGPSSK
jgi:hypothetical protein